MRRKLHLISLVCLTVSCLITFVGLMWMLWGPTLGTDLFATEPFATAYTGLVLTSLSFWFYCRTES